MYEQSSEISKNSYDYDVCLALSNRKDILSLKHDALSECLDRITQNNRYSLYYKYETAKQKNAIIDHIKNDLDVYSVDNVVNKLEKILASKTLGFDISKYPYGSYLLAHYVHNLDKADAELDKLVAFIAKQNKKKGLMAPSKFEKELKDSFTQALTEIKKEVANYDFFKDVLSEKGYQMAVAAILNGNVTMLRNIKAGLNNYTEIKDIKLELSNLSDMDKKILEFAYTNSDTASKYNQIINNYVLRFSTNILHAFIM